MGHCCCGLKPTSCGVAPVPGPASQAARAVPGAPEWHVPHREPSDTPAPGACLHTCRTRTRLARSCCVAARPNPAAACAPWSAPASPLLKAAQLPLPASALPPLEGTPLRPHSQLVRLDLATTAEHGTSPSSSPGCTSLTGRIPPRGLRGLSTGLAHSPHVPSAALLGPSAPALTLNRPPIRPMRYA